MFWYGWNSWVVELLGGTALGAAFSIGLEHAGAALFFANVGSAVYEWTKLDANHDNPAHRPWRDFGQRSIGIAIGVTGWLLLH